MSAFDIGAIDEVIHGRVRLGAMAYLSAVHVADFTEIARRLQTTDGNLSVHLRKLERAGYAAVDKSFVGRRPLTRIRITAAGREAFDRYLTTMAALIAVRNC